MNCRRRCAEKTPYAGDFGADLSVDPGANLRRNGRALQLVRERCQRTMVRMTLGGHMVDSVRRDSCGQRAATTGTALAPTIPGWRRLLGYL
jgi:hypothetical protein